MVPQPVSIIFLAVAIVYHIGVTRTYVEYVIYVYTAAYAYMYIHMYIYLTQLA